MTENDDLAVNARTLAGNVSALSGSVQSLSDRISRSETLLRWTVLALVLIVLLAGGVAWIFRVQYTSNAQLNATIAREELVRSEVLCPLYALLIGTYNPGSRTAGPDRENYEHAFRVMRDGYHKLQCKTPIVPPRTQ